MIADGETREQVRARGGKLPPGVYWRHRTLWVAYYVTAPDGRRVQHREPTDATSPREAASIRAERITEHARGERTVEARTLTVADAMAAVLLDYETNKRRSIGTARSWAAAIETAFGKTTRAAEITTTTVQAVQARWLRANIAPATVNRRCNLLRRGLRLLVRARRLPFVPYIPRLKEDKRRARYITAKEAATIRGNLPAYAADVFELALLLGIRKGQLTRTLRRFVDLERALIAWPPEECKHEEAHTVPLDDEALAIVQRAMDAAVPWCPFLFHGPDCKPGHKPANHYGCVGDFKKAFQTAVEAANLPYGRKVGGVVFHCTRSTAATDLRAGGMAESDCMAVGGWKTRSVFDRYNLGDVEALRDRLTAARGRRGKVVPLHQKATG